MTILVRRAEADDIAAMSCVLTASIVELCAADHGDDPEAIAAWTRNKTPEGVAAMLANPDLLLFVAEGAGKIGAVGAVNRSGEVALNKRPGDWSMAIRCGRSPGAEFRASAARSSRPGSLVWNSYTESVTPEHFEAPRPHP